MAERPQDRSSPCHCAAEAVADALRVDSAHRGTRRLAEALAAAPNDAPAPPHTPAHEPVVVPPSGLTRSLA